MSTSSVVPESDKVRLVAGHPPWRRHLVALLAAGAYWWLLQLEASEDLLVNSVWFDLVVWVGPILALSPWMRRVDLEPAFWLAGALIIPFVAAIVIWKVVYRGMALPVRTWAPVTAHLSRVRPVPGRSSWTLSGEPDPTLPARTLQVRGRRWVGRGEIAARWAPLVLVPAVAALLLPDDWGWVRVALLVPLAIAGLGSHFVRQNYVDAVRRTG